jgi:hypothetical protein
MNRLILFATLFMPVKQSANSVSQSADQITYEVKTIGVSSWSGDYLDATNSMTMLQKTSNWSTTFANEAPVPRYLKLQLFTFKCPGPGTLIATIYVNGKMVKSDTTTGYPGRITPPFVMYNLLK